LGTEKVYAMSVKRSPEMVLVGYFLARSGRHAESGTLPPLQLDTNHWNRAYAAFFAALGGGRTLQTFSNSLKNARDLFDARVDSGRVGWRQRGSDREPLPLTNEAQRVFERWEDASDEELWETVAQYADIAATQVTTSVLTDALAEFGPDEQVQARTEGGRRVVVSTRIERDPRLRDDAIRLHGTSCIVCGFNYGEVYGDWGDGFVEVHHLDPIGDSETETRATDPAKDLTVLCANCHRMVHRRRGLVLSVHELRTKIDGEAARAWATGLISGSE